MQPVAGRDSSCCSLPMFQRRNAETTTTGTPIAAESAAMSTPQPSEPSSSAILRATTNGTAYSLSWSARSSVRRRLVISPTCSTSTSASRTRRSRATTSSSDCGSRLLMPGVSMTVRLTSPIVAVARVISTVVPG